MVVEWLMNFLGVNQTVAQLLITAFVIGIVLIIIALADGGLLCCGIAGSMLLFMFGFIFPDILLGSIIVIIVIVSALVAKQLAGGSGGGVEGD